MRITFWGVRGSIATSGPEFARFGGHTTCVEVEAKGARIILDAGTGLRALGQKMIEKAPLFRRPIEATFFFSHLHWDHIQGFPFFGPAFLPDARFRMYGPKAEHGENALHRALDAQMRPPTFPVPLGAMPSKKEFLTIESGEAIEIGPFVVTARALAHPQGSLGYRIEAGKKAFCFATDTEQESGKEIDDAILSLAKGADLFAFDAQYTEGEYAVKKGWGHSTYVAAAEIAEASCAKRLALIHHDPTHSDEVVEKIERETQALFPAGLAAREGMVVDL
jgi:phosphoribosyl 1,2-cyclic phosphodiesterase